MRRSRPCCITIPARVISSAAISGTCARPAVDWAIRPPSRQRGRRPTRWKWACPISLARCIARRSGPIAPCSKEIWGAQAFAIAWPGDVEQVCNQPGPPPANDPMPVHLTRVGSRPGRRHLRSDGAVHRRLRGLRRGDDLSPPSSMRCWRARRSSRRRSRRATTCFAARRNATIVTATAARRRSAVHRFHREQYRNPRKSAASLLCGARPDARGYVANPAGSAFVDPGVGGFSGVPILSVKSVNSGSFAGAAVAVAVVALRLAPKQGVARLLLAP